MSKIERSQNDLVSKINQEYAKVAARLGLGFNSSGFEVIGPFPGGTFGRVNHVFTSQRTPDIYTDTNIITFTAHGLAAAIQSEPLKCYCALFVDKPAPASIYVKQIREGFRKKPIWVPFDRSMKAADVYKSRSNWNGLVDALNADKELEKQIGRFRTDNNVHGIDQRLTVGRGKTFPVRVNDAENNHGTVCMIIPMGNRTLVATQNVLQNPKDIEPALQAIQRIASTIQSYGYDQPTTGPMISDYAEDLLKKMPQGPTSTPVSKPTPPLPAPKMEQEGITCPSCGHVNAVGQKFCGECGSALTQSQICSKCGAENPVGHKFCGECGAPLGVQPPPVPEQPEIDVSDPLEQLITEIRGGKDAQWTVRYQTTKQEYEGRLWNIANEGYFMGSTELMELTKRIPQNHHYQLFENIKYVKAPNGKALTGGFMNLAVVFDQNAPDGLTGRSIQVLLLPRDDNTSDTPIRMLASTDKEMNPSLLGVMIDVLVNNPGQVKEFYLWGVKK